LELRVFSESGLRKSLADAGFEHVSIHAEDYPEYGIVHQEAWSLPISARRRAPGNRELVHELLERNWNEGLRLLREENFRLHAELVARTEWVRGLERQLTSEMEARTKWARDLEAQLLERTLWAQRRDEDLRALETHLGRTRASLWYRLGRRLGLIA
jgi:hypothetical protein